MTFLRSLITIPRLPVWRYKCYPLYKIISQFRPPVVFTTGKKNVSQCKP